MNPVRVILSVLLLLACLHPSGHAQEQTRKPGLYATSGNPELDRILSEKSIPEFENRYWYWPKIEKEEYILKRGLLHDLFVPPGFDPLKMIHAMLDQAERLETYLITAKPPAKQRARQELYSLVTRAFSIALETGEMRQN